MIRQTCLPLLLFKQKTVLCAFFMTGLLWVCLPCTSMAQRPLQDDLRSRTMERLDDTEAARLLKYFKAQRLDEDFCFRFQLKHKPRRGRTTYYEGIMYGSWNEKGPVSRVKLYPNKVSDKSSAELSPIDMIVQNGRLPQVWVRRGNSGGFTLIEDSSLFEPIFDGIMYTPFDLQMPFIYWDNYEYEGPSRVLSRIGQKFLMFPPEGSLAELNGISAVRVSIDDTYYALLRAEVLQDDNKVRSQFTVRGIKKIQDRYIVKEVELKNLLTKDATIFRVEAASVGLKLNDSIFNPNQPEEPPKLSAISLEEF